MRSITRTFVATANTGDNTVSVLRLSLAEDGLYFLAPANMPPLQPSYSVPAPFGVTACGGFLVTSSGGTTISWLPFSVDLVGTVSGGEMKTIVVGPQPYSAICAGFGMAWVSTAGDSTLSLVDLNSGSVIERITGVPGSRALHGIAIDENNNAWVAGTDANVITLVDLDARRVLTSFLVRQPIGIGLSGSLLYAASGVDNILTPIDTTTLQVRPAIPIPTNTADFVPLVVSAGNTVTIHDIQGQVIGSVPEIPGAAGLSQGSLLAPTVSGIFVASRDSNSIFLIQAKSPPQDLQFSNAASFAGGAGMAGGSLSSAFSATQLVSQAQWAVSLPLPTTLGGVSIRIGGALSFVTNSGWSYSPIGAVPVPLLFVGTSQVNFQVPPGTPLGDAVPVQLTRADGSTLLSTLRITTTAPGVFTVLQNGVGQAVVLNQNNTQNFGTNPARRGSVIQLFATGGGETTPTLLPGEAAPASGNPLVMTNIQPTVTIGGVNAPVQFSGMAPGWVGLWQINAEIPQSVTPGSAVPLVVTSGGVTSNTVTIAVE